MKRRNAIRVCAWLTALVAGSLAAGSLADEPQADSTTVAVVIANSQADDDDVKGDVSGDAQENDEERAIGNGLLWDTGYRVETDADGTVIFATDTPIVRGSRVTLESDPNSDIHGPYQINGQWIYPGDRMYRPRAVVRSRPNIDVLTPNHSPRGQPPVIDSPSDRRGVSPPRRSRSGQSDEH